MRNALKIAFLAAALAVGLAAAPALYAQDRSPRSHHGPGMMGQDGKMGMMRQMGRMMDHCSSMMGGSSRPNEQWRKDAPKAPDKKG